MSTPAAIPVRAALSSLRARAGALGLDSLLLAYALWCAHRLGWGASAAGGLLDRFPRLLLVTPLLACAWQLSGASLGQRAYDLRLKGPTDAPAPLVRRAWWALLAGLQTALLLLPLASRGVTPLGLGLTAALMACVVALVLVLRSPRSLPEWFAGVHLRHARGEGEQDLVPWYRRANPWIVLVLVALTLTVGARMTEFRPGRLVEGAERTEALWNRLLAPDWSITPRVVDLLIETVFLALMASSLAVPFAFVISFLGARNLTRGSLGGRVTYVLTRALMNITRSIEPLVWAIIFVLWVGIGPFAGMLALFVHSVASLSKLYSEAIEAIDPGPVEAIQATGARTLQVLRYGVVPQVIPPFLSFTVYRWDINVRMATILGLVGGGGIGDLLINYQQLGAWSKVGTIIVFITLVVWVMDVVSARMRARVT